MFYTRLSRNFQPKILLPPRRRFILAGFAAFLGWPKVGVMRPNAMPVLASTLPKTQITPPTTRSIIDENGQSFTLGSRRGRPLLINYWASWCAPCIAEMPSLQKAAVKLQPDDIEVLLISIDRGGLRIALPVLRAHGVTAPKLGFDPKAALSREMGVQGLPTSFLLSADQRNCVIYVGPREWHKPAMLDEIRHFVMAGFAASTRS